MLVTAYHLIRPTQLIPRHTLSAEGPFTCSNATIANNDIGPCGSDYYGYVRPPPLSSSQAD